MAPDRREYISDLKIKYGCSETDAPPNALRELTGLSNDISYRYGGKHVWLVPTYTTDPGAAATSFHLVVHNSPVAGMDDLAKGSGGGYRYVFTKSDPDEPSKIVHAVLLRSSTSMSAVPPGWDAISEDLNKGRRRSYLYVLVKTIMSNSSPASSTSRLSVPLPAVPGYLSPSPRNSAIQKEYIQRLDVVYSSSADDIPSDCIREINGQDRDVDFQTGGKSVWLVPVLTTDTSLAATSFDVLIQSYEDPKLPSFTKRAGDFRYVVPRTDRKLSERITEVGLVRSDKPLMKPPAGWQGYCVNDLNMGRKGCLYVVWKSVSTSSWSFVSLPGAISWSRSGNGATKFVRSLKVCYGDDLDDAPEDFVPEFNGQSADINHHFSGKYVWLVPEYTTSPDSAATSFTVSVQRIADLSLDDVAKGAHRGYRYVLPQYEAQSKTRVKEVQLLRSDSGLKSPPSGWTGMTKDVNEGRGRSCLYLIWKCGV